MAVLSSTNLTYADWAKTRSPGDMYAKAAEVLAQKNEVLLDQVMKEGNLETGDQQRIRTGLPSVYYRMMGEPTPSSKSTSTQITETCAILGGWSYVNKDIADLGDLARLREEEAMTFMESLAQQDAATLFYGSSTNAKAYVGLANRYNALSGSENSQNVINCGGSTNLTSAWLIGWSDSTIYGIYPKRSQAGIQHKYHDLQIINSTNGDGDLLSTTAYADEWHLKKGLMVKDWRYAVRVANIDTVALAARSGTQAITAATNIIYALSEAMDLIPSKSGVKLGIYCNRSVSSALRRMALDKTISTLTIEKGLNQFGPNIFTATFDGVPIRICDQITNAETAVA